MRDRSALAITIRGVMITWLKRFRCHGIDYFLKEITVNSLSRLSLRFQENFDSFCWGIVISVYEEQHKNWDNVSLSRRGISS